MSNKTVDAAEVVQDKEKSIGEIGRDNRIERTTEKDFVKDAEMMKFMDQEMLIVVHQSPEDGALDVITPSVNGKNQPIIRGREQKVRRKYVEVLARTRTTSYDQRVQSPAEPENINMVPKTNLTYPFAVIHDPHPNGRKWLESILNQR